MPTLAYGSATDEPIWVGASASTVVAGSAAIFVADTTPGVSERTVVNYIFALITWHTSRCNAIGWHKLDDIPGGRGPPNTLPLNKYCIHLIQ